MTEQEKLDRREARKQQRYIDKKLAAIAAERNQQRVKAMKFTIEWKKSKTWGANPHLRVEVMYKGTTWYTSGINYSVSGCGYSKECAVIEHAFNTYLKYILWEYTDMLKSGQIIEMSKTGIQIPTEERNFVSYNLGGKDQYNSIFAVFGGKFERIATGKTFDVYQLTFGEQQ